MGKLILCSGKRTNRPYVLPDTGYRIYSIEELCYYIYNNIYAIDETLFTDSLIDWIGTELCLTSRAEKLDFTIKQGADYKTLLAVVLCSSDYYTEEEIKKLLEEAAKIRTMPPVKRWFIKANSFLNRKQYTEAAAQYDRLLVSEEAVDLSPQDYGDVLHNLGIATLNIYGPGRALELFLHAYERNRKPESLRQYLYTLWLVEDIDVFDDKLQEYQISDGLREEIVLKMEQLTHDAKLCKDMDEINVLKNLNDHDRLTEVRDKSGQIIDRWINKIRNL